MKHGSSPATLLRFGSALTFAVIVPLTMATGCPFSVEEYVRKCELPTDCSDGVECTADQCNNGICENPPKPKETACGPTLGSVCDGKGGCVECLSNADCVANHPMHPVCDVGAQECVSCDDGVQNGNETDVDCGGPDCGACRGEPCDPQNGCGNNTLCAVQDNLCCDTACGDKCEACAKSKTGQPDGTCAPIPFGMDPDGECASLGSCGASPGKCRCEDGVKNADESDVDCGGAVCQRCGGGKACGTESDCALDVPACVDSACCNSICQLPCSQCNSVGMCVQVPAGYSDPTCAANQACGPSGAGCIGKAGAPCSSGFKCLSGLCLGSGKCDTSQLGKPCNDTADCAAGTCVNNLCQ